MYVHMTAILVTWRMYITGGERGIRSYLYVPRLNITIKLFEVWHANFIKNAW
jgi:hypothetical protein